MQEILEPPTEVVLSGQQGGQVGPEFVYNRHNESLYDDMRYFPALRAEHQDVVRFDDSGELINAATLRALMVQLTSPEVIDYSLICDFFLTFRVFASPEQVMQLLLTRLVWALQYIRSGDQNEKIGKLVLLRVFVVFRHWIINYFMDDFVENSILCDMFVQTVNSVVSSNLVRKESVYESKIIADLKTHWLTAAVDFGGDVKMSDKSAFDYELPTSTKYERNEHHSMHTNPSYRRSMMLSLYDKTSTNSIGPHKNARSQPKKHTHMNIKDSSRRQEASPITQARPEASSDAGFTTNGRIRLPMSDISVILPPTPVRKMEFVVVSPRNSTLSHKTSIKKFIDGWKKTLHRSESIESIKEDPITFLNNNQPKVPDIAEEIEVGGRIDVLSARIVDELEYLMRFCDPRIEEEDRNYITPTASNKSTVSVNAEKLRFSAPIANSTREEKEKENEKEKEDNENEKETERVCVEETQDNQAQTESAGPEPKETPGSEASKTMESKSAKSDTFSVPCTPTRTASPDSTPSMELASIQAIANSSKAILDLRSPRDSLNLNTHDAVCEANYNAVRSRHHSALGNSSLNTLDESHSFQRPTSINWNEEMDQREMEIEEREEKVDGEIEEKVDGEIEEKVDGEIEEEKVDGEIDSVDLRDSAMDMGDSVMDHSVMDHSIIDRKEDSFIEDSVIDKRHTDRRVHSLCEQGHGDEKQYISLNDSQNSLGTSISTPSNITQYHAEIADLGIALSPQSKQVRRISFDSVSVSRQGSAKSYISYDSALSVSRAPAQSNDHGLRKKFGFSNLREMREREKSYLDEIENDENEVRKMEDSRVESLRINSLPSFVSRSSSIRRSMRFSTLCALTELPFNVDNSGVTEQSGVQRSSRSSDVADSSIFSVAVKSRKSSAQHNSPINSVVIPGISSFVLKELAEIPDESFHSKDPVEFAFLKLEGRKTRRQEETDVEDTQQILDAIGNARTEDVVETTIVTQTPPLATRPVMESTPNVSQDIFLAGYVPSSVLQIEHITRTQAHVSFVLSYDSRRLAEHFTLIEKDMLLEVDWKELIELKWNKEVTPVNSWLEIIVNDSYYYCNRGVNLVIARFNLMVNWIISEVLLTASEYERICVISRFIHVAQNCYALQNYTTLMQVILALTSEKVSKLKETWKNLPPGDILMLKNLEELTSPLKNFYNIRKCVAHMTPSRGCIPFVGLYLSDLIFNAERPSFVKKTPESANVTRVEMTPVHTMDIPYESPATNDLSSSTIDSDKLINFAKYRTSVHIVRSLSQCIEWSACYELSSDPELLSKCLYIKSLDEDEMNYCLDTLLRAQ